MSNAGLITDYARSLVEATETPEMQSLSEMVRDRLKVYKFAAPLHLYHAVEHGQKIAMLLIGVDEHEYDSVIDAYLSPIEADLIRRGFCAKVSADWCEGLAGEAGIYQC